MAPLSRRERADLSDLMDSLGPEAPTLCGTWTTYDLAAHLVLRERSPTAAPGIVLPPLAALADRGMGRLKAEHDYPHLVDLVRSGPPVWSPMRLGEVDRMFNTVEFFVHHEDVRRAQPGWTPRRLEPRDENALWAALRRMGRVLARRSTVGIDLVRTDDEGRVTAKRGEPTLVVEGRAGELVLFAYGRTEVADVVRGGDVRAGEQFDAGRLGL
ncbi:MAG: TIGR03085 family protein [Propionibacteriales bacterium]|nr:TIGR03085 family protein [Propionibacteriales bacterium]